MVSLKGPSDEAIRRPSESVAAVAPCSPHHRHTTVGRSFAAQKSRARSRPASARWSLSVRLSDLMTRGSPLHADRLVRALR